MFLKYIFRLIHIASFGFYSAIFISEFVINDENKDFRLSTAIPKKLHIIFGLLLSISGLINMIILIKDNKYQKDQFLTKWKYLLYFKFCLFILLTPFFDNIVLPLIPVLKDYKEQKMKIKCIFFLLGLLVSPYTRFYRESKLTKSKLA